MSIVKSFLFQIICNGVILGVYVLKAMILREYAEIRIENEPRRYPGLPLKDEPLELVDLDVPEPGPSEVLIKISACGVCQTDIDIIEGRRSSKLPVILGHQAIGRVVKIGSEVSRVRVGDRVGVAWIGWSCGSCTYCVRSEENLCNMFKATGCDLDGCYSEYMVAGEAYVYRIPDVYDDVEAAPLLCAGAIGYRALRLLNMRDDLTIGLFGFGASAHQLIQVIRKLYPTSKILVFTRSRDHAELAESLGADWTGPPTSEPPEKLDRAIDFTPVGEITARALNLLKPGGRLVVNVIRKRTPVTLDYTQHLWMEKEVKSVANVTRKDVQEYLEVVSRVRVRVSTNTYKLEDANKALKKVKIGEVRGAIVLKP